MTIPCDVNLTRRRKPRDSATWKLPSRLEAPEAEASYENLEENRGKFMVSWCCQKHAVQPGGLKNHETYYIGSNLTINHAETSIFYHKVFLWHVGLPVVPSWQW